MGRRSWFSSVRKAFSPGSKNRRAQKEAKLNEESGKEMPSGPERSTSETINVSHPLPPMEEVKFTEVEIEQEKRSYSVVTAADAETVPCAAQVAQPTAASRFTGKSKEEAAAIGIQTAFRGYLARRAFRALKGLVKLKSLVEGPAVKRQTANALRYMQTLFHVQTQVYSRRMRMLLENRAFQKQLLQKHVKEVESLTIGEDWDDSLQSREQIEASLLSKYEATMRRERALAYSYSHQQSWKKSARSTNLLFMDPTNPHWGWSWLERWMAARPWETQSMAEKEPKNDLQSVKCASLRFAGGEITKAYVRHQLNSDKLSSPMSQKPSRPSSRQSPSTPPSKTAYSVPARKLKSASPKTSLPCQDDDSKSVFSVMSDLTRRHSIAGLYVRDDESMASSPSVPSYMAATKSAKAKSRLQSPLGIEEDGTLEKSQSGSAKKRLSFPASPARTRRHSGPPKVNCGLVTDENTSNGNLN